MATTGNSKPFWGRKTYCVITGASQGIGKQIAIDFAKNVAPDSTFLLLARNVDKLNETKKAMEEANSKVNVLTHSVNLSEPIGVELHKLMSVSLIAYKQEATDFELCMVVHNAASLGDVSESVTEMKNLEKLEAYFVLNLHSVILLNGEFIKTFEAASEKAELAFINITSLCAIQPFPSMGYYCMGKSARESYFGVLALENKHYTVLSYAPGPVYTDMTNEIINNVRDGGVKDSFVNMKNESTLLTTEQTVGRLIGILKDRAFENGKRKDYYDE